MKFGVSAFYLPSLPSIVVKFEEINLKFEKVRKSSRYNKVRKSSRSTCNHDCYRNTLSIVLIL